MSMREVNIYAMAYEAAGIEVPQENKVIYNGGDYWIEQDQDGRVWFSDNNVTEELSKIPNDPSYIKYDENRGWIYKNGRDLPWKEGF